MTYQDAPRSPRSSISTLFWWAAGAWMAWITLVMAVVVVQEAPAVALAVFSLVLWLFWHLARARKGARRRAFAEHWASRARFHQQERLNRALHHPDLVFEDNAALWAKEMQ